MLNWIFTNYLRDESNPPLPTQASALALLSSTVADGDVITDWLYYKDIVTSDEEISQWLITLQLISCICGTFSWLGVATDGRLVNWVRTALVLMACIPFGIVWLLLSIPDYALRWSCKCSYAGGDRWNLFYDWIVQAKDWCQLDVLLPLWKNSSQKMVFSSSVVLLFGILVEDIPQLVVTFLIEERIKSDDPTGQISNAALVNLLFAMFDIVHKLAQAYDLRADVLNEGYSVQSTIKAHEEFVMSLASAGANRLLSASGDYTAKLWDTVTGKCIQTFHCGSWANDAVAVGTSKVIVACSYKVIRIYDLLTQSTGFKLNQFKVDLQFKPDFVCVSPDHQFFFTGGSDKAYLRTIPVSSFFLQRWALPVQSGDEPQLISTYKHPVTSLAFLDGDRFISCYKDLSRMHVWDVNEEEPMHSLKLEFRGCAILVMTPTLFLVGDGKIIKSFEFVNHEWTVQNSFPGHTSSITSFTKVNESLFVSTSEDTTAKLWNLNIESSCLFTFRGHTEYVRSSAFLKEQGAIASASGRNGNIKIWSIAKYILNNAQREEEDIVQP
jgi:WD40 repeat protein